MDTINLCVSKSTIIYINTADTILYLGLPPTAIILSSDQKRLPTPYETLFMLPATDIHPPPHLIPPIKLALCSAQQVFIDGHVFSRARIWILRELYPKIM